MNRDFITAGNAIFTLEVPPTFQAQHGAKPHYTFKVRHKKASDDKAEKWFVNLLTGPDNTSDYTYLGILNPLTGEVRTTKASKLEQSSLVVRLLERAMARVWEDRVELLREHGFDLHHEGKCCRCGRVLTTPESVTSGIGPECLKVQRKAR